MLVVRFKVRCKPEKTEQALVSRAERFRTTWVSTSSDYVRVMDQRLCQWLLCQANS